MTEIANDLLLRTLRREPAPRRPVWLMRQAGRYMEEYLRVRKRAGSFMAMCRSPETCCEITLQPIERFGLDAAIIFSDILTIPAEMGLDLHFVEGKGPRFGAPLATEAQMLAAEPPPLESLRYVFDAVAATRKALGGRVPLIGFAGAPFTLMCYMVEGSGGDFLRARLALRSAERGVHALLSAVADAAVSYLEEQAKAGADAVMLFESWGDLLSDEDFGAFSAPYLDRVVAGVKGRCPGLPVIVFVRAGSRWCERVAATGCDAVGVDWRADLGEVRERTGGKVAVQGNLDPAVLLAERPEDVRAAASRCVESYGPAPGHVFNLGHGVNLRTPPENVEVLVEAVRSASERLLAGGSG